MYTYICTLYIYRKENYVHNEEGNVYAAINIKETVQERIIILKAIKRGKKREQKDKGKKWRQPLFSFTGLSSSSSSYFASFSSSSSMGESVGGGEIMNEGRGRKMQYKDMVGKERGEEYGVREREERKNRE